MMAFIDQHRSKYGVEPICRQLPIAPSTYSARRRQQAEPSLRSSRAQQDDVLRRHIRRVWDDSFGTYGARKVWRQLRRRRQSRACTVERLMHEMGLQGVVRGRRAKTTMPSPAAPCPRDLVNRDFNPDGPNRLWVADLTAWHSEQAAMVAA